MPSWFSHSLLFVLCLVGFKTVAAVTPQTISPALHLGQQAGSNSSQPNNNGIAPLSLADDGTYYTVIEAGKISFRVSIDTGSSDLWLVSTDCNTPTCSAVPKYPLTYDSPTFVSVNNNATDFSVSYADGTGASGFVAMESVEVSNVTVSKQAFGLVTNSNVSLSDDSSGILGLGFPRLSEINALSANATPFIASLCEQGILDYPIFGLSLTRNSTGTIALGAIDVSVVRNESEIVWNDVVPFSPLVGTQETTSGYMYWAIYLTGFAVNGSSLAPMPTYPGPAGNSSIALLDVGTNGLYGPYQDVTRLYELFPGSRLVDESGQWAVPCDSSAIMSFSFGTGSIFNLQPTDYIIGPTAGNPEMCLSWPIASPPNPNGIDWELGTPFLRTVYSAWSYGIDDFQPPMIGLYSLYNSSTPVESPAQVALFFASPSATIATTLPNYLLPTPTYSTPPYAFNTAVPAPFGEIVVSELATNTYLPLVATPETILPKVSDAYTLIVTDAQGDVMTSTYHLTEPSVVLGLPPGWSSAQTLRAPAAALCISLLAAVCAGVWIL